MLGTSQPKFGLSSPLRPKLTPWTTQQPTLDVTAVIRQRLRPLFQQATGIAAPGASVGMTLFPIRQHLITGVEAFGPAVQKLTFAQFTFKARGVIEAKGNVHMLMPLFQQQAVANTKGNKCDVQMRLFKPVQQAEGWSTVRAGGEMLLAQFKQRALSTVAGQDAIIGQVLFKPTIAAHGSVANAVGVAAIVLRRPTQRADGYTNVYAHAGMTLRAVESLVGYTGGMAHAKEVFPAQVEGMTLKNFRMAAQAEFIAFSSIHMTLAGPISQAAVARASPVGAISMMLPLLQQTALSGVAPAVDTSVAQTLFRVQQVAQGVLVPSGAIGMVLFKPTQAAVAHMNPKAQIVQTLFRPTMSAIGGVSTIVSEEDMIPQGRLTLTSAVPVLNSDTTAQSTVYYTPYVGQNVPVWDGSKFNSTTFAEVSQALSDTSKSPAAAAASKVYDMFVWSDSGTIRCTRGPAWSTNTSRGTGSGTSELQRVQGMLVNAQDISNGPAAGYGVYVGTIATDGNTQLNMQFKPAAAAGGTGNRLDVWNMYNRRMVVAVCRDSTDSWTYATATFRAANNSNNWRVTFVVGLNEDGVNAFFSMGCDGNSTNSQYQMNGIGLDSITAPSDGFLSGGFSVSFGYTAFNSNHGAWGGLPGIGSHFLQLLERCSTSTRTFWGDRNDAGLQSGMTVQLPM